MGDRAKDVEMSENQRRVLALAPNAFCSKRQSIKESSEPCWVIYDQAEEGEYLLPDSQIAISMISEEHAWKWALSILNQRFISYLS